MCALKVYRVPFNSGGGRSHIGGFVFIYLVKVNEVKFQCGNTILKNDTISVSLRVTPDS